MSNRIDVLNNINEYFQQIVQWLPNHIDLSAKYMLKAEALIEYLEVKDCGSIGGYDENNKPLHKSTFKLYDRFLTLVNKYGNENDIETECGFNLDNLGLYFSRLSNLRDEVLESEKE